MFLEVNLVDLITRLFKGLYSLSQALYTFISEPLGMQIASNGFVKAMADFSILGWHPFQFIIDTISSLLPFSILDALPWFIILGLSALIIKHLIPLS